MIPPELKKLFEKQGYALVGSHSAVKVCEWAKKSLRGKGFCYKQKFYGIESHRCLQMTPAVAWCTQRCVYCWRPVELTLGYSLSEEDSPEEIVEKSILAQRKLLSGFGGFEGVEKNRFEESKNPKHAAISLAGEPTIYSKIGDLIGAFHSKGFTTFLVTNGTLPERLETISNEPTQLYLSLDAPDEDTYVKIDRPAIGGGWEKLNKTIGLFPSFKCRKVLRLTLVKGLNDFNQEGYAKIIAKADPDLVEIKSYMCIGFSRNRLSLDNMLSHAEVRAFSEKLAECLSYRIKDEKIDSRVVLLSK